MGFKVIRVPSHYGAPKKGTDFGPKAIFEDLGLDNYLAIKECNELTINPIDVLTSESRLEEIVEINTTLKQEVSESVSKGLTPIVLHGDDSSIMGTGFGLLETKKNFGIIYFDAHGDINSPKTSLSGCLFGMGLSHLTGDGFNEILEISDNSIFLPLGNICLEPEIWIQEKKY